MLSWLRALVAMVVTAQVYHFGRVLGWSRWGFGNGSYGGRALWGRRAIREGNGRRREG